jgi:hypothetical protein
MNENLTGDAIFIDRDLPNELDYEICTNIT